MLSITDLLDFIDLDRATVELVSKATGLPVAESTTLASQLLATEQGVSILHHMYLDQISAATAPAALPCQENIRQSYRHFSRKYPIPGLQKKVSCAP